MNKNNKQITTHLRLASFSNPLGVTTMAVDLDSFTLMVGGNFTKVNGNCFPYFWTYKFAVV